VRSLPIQEAAFATRRTVQAVHHRRHKFKLTAPRTWRPWTADEDRLAVSLSFRLAAAALPHRSLHAIHQRRTVIRSGRGGRTKPKTTALRVPPAVEKFIRTRFGKLSAAELGRQFGVGQADNL
jgi:hypothetical protein